jgi:hypothetical protein
VLTQQSGASYKYSRRSVNASIDQRLHRKVSFERKSTVSF